MLVIAGHDWYYAAGDPIDQAVGDALDRYDARNTKTANFVQLCDADLGELRLNGRLHGITVYRRNGERGNIAVGRVERV